MVNVDDMLSRLNRVIEPEDVIDLAQCRYDEVYEDGVLRNFICDLLDITSDELDVILEGGFITE